MTDENKTLTHHFHIKVDDFKSRGIIQNIVGEVLGDAASPYINRLMNPQMMNDFHRDAIEKFCAAVIDNADLTTKAKTKTVLQAANIIESVDKCRLGLRCPDLFGVYDYEDGWPVAGGGTFFIRSLCVKPYDTATQLRAAESACRFMLDNQITELSGLVMEECGRHLIFDTSNEDLDDFDIFEHFNEIKRDFEVIYLDIGRIGGDDE